MSSITVEVIFMGLIGFVPHEGQRGMTALMVDPAAKGGHEHVPYVLVLNGDGECLPRGNPDCFRSCDQFRQVADVSIRPNMCWQLTGEDLKILGNQASLKFDQTGYLTMFGNPKEVPSWGWQANDYSWVPGMDLLTGGYGRVLNSCMAEGKPCKLVRSRLRLRGGHATACHLIHMDTGKAGEKRNVIKFPYLVGSEKFEQVVADAAKVEFQIEGDEVYLHSWAFRKGGQKPHKASVTLKPSDRERRLTLIVTNFPGPGDDTGSNFHAEVLFDLLAVQPTVRPTRKNCAKEYCKEFLRHPGSCESEATQIEELFNAAREPKYIHSPTFCDGMSFQR